MPAATYLMTRLKYRTSASLAALHTWLSVLIPTLHIRLWHLADSMRLLLELTLLVRKEFFGILPELSTCVYNFLPLSHNQPVLLHAPFPMRTGPLTRRIARVYRVSAFTSLTP